DKPLKEQYFRTIAVWVGLVNHRPLLANGHMHGGSVSPSSLYFIRPSGTTEPAVICWLLYHLSPAEVRKIRTAVRVLSVLQKNLRAITQAGRIIAGEPQDCVLGIPVMVGLHGYVANMQYWIERADRPSLLGHQVENQWRVIRGWRVGVAIA